VEILLRSSRDAFRTITGRPTFSAAIAVVLGLGIGASTAIFSVVNPLLIRPLPFKDPDRLVMVWERNEAKGVDWFPVQPADFAGFREQNLAFESIAAARDWWPTMTASGEPERLHGALASATFFDLLGVRPTIGRAFEPDEDQPGRDQVVVLSDALWRQRFGGSREIVGQTVQLDNREFTIVGVLPHSFQFATKFDFWAPLDIHSPKRGLDEAHTLLVFARLKKGVSIQQAGAEIRSISSAFERDYPETNSGWSAVLYPIHKFYLGLRNMSRLLYLLLGAVGLLLVTACANAAGLLLVRASSMTRETAIRSALGAGRFTLVSKMLTESVFLAMIGGFLGFAIAHWATDLIVSVLPYVPNFTGEPIGVDRDALVFAIAVSVLSGMFCGLIPALQASRPNLIEALKAGGRQFGDSRGTRLFRESLIVVEIALSLLLTAEAGMMYRSFRQLSNVSIGLDHNHVLTALIRLLPSKYSTPDKVAAFSTDAIARIQSLPGVAGAAVAVPRPMGGGGEWWAQSFTIESQLPPSPAEVPSAYSHAVSPDYFRALRISLIEGREFGVGDSLDSPRVAIVSRRFAEQYWPGEDAVGKRIRKGGLNSTEPWSQIVGIAGDVKYYDFGEAPRPEIYWPYAQSPDGFFSVVVRTRGDPEAIAPALRGAIWSIDTETPLSEVRSMDALVGDRLARQRFAGLLMGVFAGTALIIAALGIYGVISYWASLRVHETGVRIALGASRSDILGDVMGKGLKLVALGVCLGNATALALSRFVSGLLYGVSPHDPWALGFVSILLLGVGLLASCIPARRSMNIDPAAALRCA
jgi:putative ABC transport system permease protein